MVQPICALLAATRAILAITSPYDNVPHCSTAGAVLCLQWSSGDIV